MIRKFCNVCAQELDGCESCEKCGLYADLNEGYHGYDDEKMITISSTDKAYYEANRN